MNITIEKQDAELLIKALGILEKEVEKLEKQLVSLGRPLNSSAELRARIQSLRTQLL